MLKRELKISKKSLIIWISICIILYLFVFLIYPTISSSENISMLNEMLTMFPDEVMKTFNMDISSISTVFGWFKTEGYTYISLILAIYSSMLGFNILLKEEDDKTIEFLYSKPIRRNNIISSKIKCGIINIFTFIISITIFNLVGMALSNDLELRLFLILSLVPLLTSIPLFFVGMLLSTYLQKTKIATTMALGIVFLSYFLQIISLLTDKVKFLKYLSLFTLSDSRSIILTGDVNYLSIIISLLISLVCGVLIYRSYNRKELI